MVIVQRLVDFVTLLNAMEALIESSRNGDQQIAIEEIIHQCRTAWFHEWNGQRSFSFLFLFFFFLRLEVVEIFSRKRSFKAHGNRVFDFFVCCFAAAVLSCVNEGLRALSQTVATIF